MIRKKGTVVVREVAGEVLLVPVRGQLVDMKRVFVVNEAGRFLWDAIGDGADREALAARLGRSFGLDDEKAKADVDAFLKRLAGMDLVEITPPAPTV